MTGERWIAVAQTVPVPGDVDANLAQHLALIDEAAAGGAALVVFPELSLTGYEIELAPSLAFTPGDPRLRPLIDASAARRMTIVAGAPVTLGTALHIAAFILAPDGAVELYTKHRLGAFSAAAAVDGDVPPAESTVFDRGDVNPFVQVGDATAAVAICADTGRASHVDAAARRGARIYLASMFVIPSEFDRDAAVLGSYAATRRMVVAMANYGGPTGGLAAAGRSSIWSETGELLARLTPQGPGVAVAKC